MSTDWPVLVGGLSALLAVAVGALSWLGVPLRRQIVTSALRAAVQLALIGLALRGVFAAPAAVIAVVAVMLGTAIATAWGRLGRGREVLVAVAVAIVVGAAPVVAVVEGLPLVPQGVRYLVAMSGICIGGAMTAVTLTGRSLGTALRRRREEVEGWLALGATPRQAVLALARDAVVDGLVPGIDQTRTVGLVTLPGTFVGALLGGAGAGDAARFQIVVLVGLLAVQSLSAVSLVRLLGAPAVLPAAVGAD